MKGDPSLSVHLHRRAIAKCRARLSGAIRILLGGGRGAIRIRAGRGRGAVGVRRARVRRPIGLPSSRGPGAIGIRLGRHGAVVSREDLVRRAIGRCRGYPRAGGLGYDPGRGAIGKGRGRGRVTTATRQDLVPKAIGICGDRVYVGATAAGGPPGLRGRRAIGVRLSPCRDRAADLISGCARGPGGAIGIRAGCD